MQMAIIKLAKNHRQAINTQQPVGSVVGIAAGIVVGIVAGIVGGMVEGIFARNVIGIEVMFGNFGIGKYNSRLALVPFTSPRKAYYS
ncbi:hypothetical protein RHMOL_Rhmol08G0017700 [Rhododendron molle]|uniref:Uncharacterized protein n=1 Tax=Rhododendron molle TaxID=49168 RepID=A0ACC0MIP6_RHOML|nr:hypothetical protein RHMOL_Rhmol08G0017700 [Rhododendron molle]